MQYKGEYLWKRVLTYQILETQLIIQRRKKLYLQSIGTYAVKTDQSLYSAGWMLDIARCLYTLETGKIIGKTSAGEQALENNLCSDSSVLEKVIEIRKEPLHFKNDESTKQWLETLGPSIQCFADVLEKGIKIYSQKTNVLNKLIKKLTYNFYKIKVILNYL